MSIVIGLEGPNLYRHRVKFEVQTNNEVHCVGSLEVAVNSEYDPDGQKVFSSTWLVYRVLTPTGTLW